MPAQIAASISAFMRFVQWKELGWASPRKKTLDWTKGFL